MALFSRQTHNSTAAEPPAPDLGWVDEFIRNVKPYIHVREEDSLLIRKPNQAHRLNDQGVRVLRFLLDGGRASSLAAMVREPEQLDDIALFLFEVRRCLEGTLRDGNHTRAVVVEPLAVNFSQLPVLSEVALTSRCNLRCLFCYAGCACGKGQAAGSGPASGSEPASGIGTALTRPEMTTAEVKKVLEKIYHEAQVPSVSFTGGEPLLRDDIYQLISHAAATGFRVNLITNGTLVNEKVAGKLRAAGLDSAQVSLEGTVPEVHESVTGVAHSFERSVAAVACLSEAGITVHTNTTMNRRNLEDCLEMPYFVKTRLGLERFSMNLVIPSGSAAHNEPLLVRYSEAGDYIDRILESSNDLGVEFMWYSPTPLCIFNPIIRGLGNKGCAACDGLLSVDCNGDVLPCSSFADPVGNILARDFREIWDSRRARSYRLKELAHPLCHGCDNLNACHGACPLYWRHFGYGELEARQAGAFEKNRVAHV